MTIKEIYEKFDKIGCLTFTTVENNIPTSRIAHLRGYDENGIYFMTMHTKSFYRYLKNNPYIAICGMNAPTTVTHDEDGLPLFESGYTIRLTGKVKEISIEELIKKNNPMFEMGIKDADKYKAMVCFCIESGYGEVFDYDFEKVVMDHKVERTPFAYNGAELKRNGLKIDNSKCISCGKCFKKCSFNAIVVDNNNYSINPNRCDECGDCYLVCPKDAIISNGKNQ